MVLIEGERVEMRQRVAARWGIGCHCDGETELLLEGARKSVRAVVAAYTADSSAKSVTLMECNDR